MTKLDQNDLVEYTMFASVASGMGVIGSFVTAIFYGGIAIVFAIAAGAMLLGALGIL